MAVTHQSLVSIFNENVKSKAKSIALRHKQLGIWQQWTWLELSEQVNLYHAVLEDHLKINESCQQHGDQPRLLMFSSPNLHFFALSLAAIKLGISVEFIETSPFQKDPQKTILETIQQTQPHLIFAEDLKLFEREFEHLHEDKVENHLDTDFSFSSTILYLADHRINPFPIAAAFALSDLKAQLLQSHTQPFTHPRIAEHIFPNKNIEHKKQDSTSISNQQHDREQQSAFVFHKTINDQAVYTIYQDSSLIQEAETLIQAHQLTQNEQAFITRSFASHDHIRYLFSTWLIAGFCMNIPESFETRDQDRQIISPTLILGTAETYQRVADLIQLRLPQTNHWIFRVFPKLKTWHWQFADQYSKPEQGFEKILNALFKQSILAALGFSHLRTAIVVGDLGNEHLAQFYQRLDIELKTWNIQADWQKKLSQNIQIQSDKHTHLNLSTASGDAYVTAQHP